MSKPEAPTESLRTRPVSLAVTARLHILGGTIAGLHAEYESLLQALPYVEACRTCKGAGWVKQPSPATDSTLCPSCSGLRLRRVLEVLNVRIPRAITVDIMRYAI